MKKVYCKDCEFYVPVVSPKYCNHPRNKLTPMGKFNYSPEVRNYKKKCEWYKWKDKEGIMEISDNFGCKQTLKNVSTLAHYVDIRVRYDGNYYWFEGDFLKDIFNKVRFVRKNKDISCKGISDHLAQNRCVKWEKENEKK